MPQWIEADAYLFDIDGTLLNAHGGTHMNAFHTAIERVLGLRGTLNGLPVHGNTDIGILRAFVRRANFPEAEFEAKLPALLKLMCAEVERNRREMRSEACPSVPELVRMLAERGKLLGVASGNLASIGWLKIEAAGLREYFSFGSFSDQFERRAEIFAEAVTEVRRRLGPDASVCVVGDTPNDIQAAREVGIPVIAVATGIFSLGTLAELSPDLCLPCCSDLLALAPV
ncbi:MAG TPA: HAD family hydrolase [Terriglobales bacterium]|nr:HAD family hydrolase [Terriglobales bacterium]